MADVQKIQNEISFMRTSRINANQYMGSLLRALFKMSSYVQSKKPAGWETLESMLEGCADDFVGCVNELENIRVGIEIIEVWLDDE